MSNELGPPSERAGERRLRLVRADAVPADGRLAEPFYAHLEGSDELHRALEHVQGLLRKESLVGPAEGARLNAGVAVADLLSALQGRLHGEPTHEAAVRIDRVTAAIWNRDSDTVATISLVQAIIDESKRFGLSEVMPDYSKSCPDSMEAFMARWPEHWMELGADKFIAAAKAWSQAERGGNAALWEHIAAAVNDARLGKKTPEALRRAVRKWEESGQISR